MSNCMNLTPAVPASFILLKAEQSLQTLHRLHTGIKELNTI